MFFSLCIKFQRPLLSNNTFLIVYYISVIISISTISQKNISFGLFKLSFHKKYHKLTPITAYEYISSGKSVITRLNVSCKAAQASS